jgi:uncharacterized protein (DUF2267 family)
LDLLDSAIADAGRWVQDVMEELGEPNRHRAYSALRSVLHAIRDQLSFEDAMDFAAHLPPVVRGFTLDGWDRNRRPRPDKSREAFLSRVAEQLVQVPDLPPERAAQAVFRTLARRVTEGRLPQPAWPAPLRALWPSPGRDAPAAPALPEPDRKARAGRVKEEIQAALDRARQEGVPEEELPVLTRRRRTSRARRRTNGGRTP